MSDLTSIVYYIFEKYLNDPEKTSLEEIIKILYLVDWKNTISYGKPLSNIIWKINDFEPQTDEDSLNEIIKGIIKHRSKERHNLIVREQDRQEIERSIKISNSEIQTINFVFKWLTNKSETELRRLVYSTYPAISKNNSEQLNLPDLAKEYEEVKLELNAL